MNSIQCKPGTGATRASIFFALASKRDLGKKVIFNLGIINYQYLDEAQFMKELRTYGGCYPRPRN